MINEKKLNQPWFLLVTALVLCVADFLIFRYGVQTKEHDINLFLTALQYFKQLHIPAGIINTPDVFVRIERPLEVFLAWPFSYFLNGSFSFYLVNSILYAFSGVLLFRTYQALFGEDKFAFYAALFYYFNLIPLHFGLTVLAETVWHFCYILALYVIVRYCGGKKEIRIGHYVLIGLVISLGFFAKETSVTAFAVMAFFLFLRIRKGYPWSKALGGMALSVVCFLIPVILWQLWIYHEFHYGIIQWFSHHYHDTLPKHKLSLFRIVLSSVTAFNLLLIPYAISLFKSKSDRILSLLLLFCGIIVPIVTVNVIDRLAFQMFPAIILFSTYYLFRETKPVWGRLFFGGYVLVNTVLLVLYRTPSIYEFFYSIIKKM
jgi:hypothetical protein